MNDKLCTKLEKAYPFIKCGIAVGDGWYWLLDQLCSFIKWKIENHKELKDFYVVQIKEKFGGLRFYTYYSDDDIEGAISFAEHMSFNICEMCGTTEDVSRDKKGWIMSLCSKCRETRDKRLRNE